MSNKFHALIEFQKSLAPTKWIEEVRTEVTDADEIAKCNNHLSSSSGFPSGYKLIKKTWFKIITPAHYEVDIKSFEENKEDIYTLEKLHSLRRIANSLTFFAVLTIIGMAVGFILALI